MVTFKEYEEYLQSWSRELSGNEKGMLYRAELLAEELLRAIKSWKGDENKSIIVRDLIQLNELAYLLDCGGWMSQGIIEEMQKAKEKK